MKHTLTYHTRTEPAMPYELLLAIWLFLCGGAGWLYSSLAKFGLCLGLCVLLMCCKIAVDKNNFDISKNSFTFVVREFLIINQDATNIEKKSGTKKKGRRTVASTEDLSRHRFGDSRSDLPPLFNNQNLFIMRESKRSSTKSASIGTFVPEIRNLHADSRHGVINGLFNRPINQLVNDFLIEMDAKNKAYYFILENGHFDAFSSYCKNSRKEVCHVNS